MRTALALIPLALLAACGSKPDASGATPDEQRQLNEAAAAPDEVPAAPATDQENAQ